MIKREDVVEHTNWIAQAKRGNQTAFSHLVDHYWQPVFNLSRHLLGDAGAAEDATQETFLRVFTKLDTYQDSRPFSAWLFTIARNYCLDQLKKSRLPAVSWDEVPAWQHPSLDERCQPEIVLIETETQSEMWAVVQSLPDDFSHALTRKYWQGESCQEIAQTLGITVNTVKGRLFRARKQVQTLVSP